MKLKFSDFKPIFVSFFLFFLLCFVVYFFGSSLMVVKANTIYSVNSDTSTRVNYIFWNNKTHSGDIQDYKLQSPFRDHFYFIPDDLQGYGDIKFGSVTFFHKYDLSSITNKTIPLYYSVILHIKYYYDITNEKYYNAGRLKTPVSHGNVYVTPLETEVRTYTSVDGVGRYSYDQFILYKGYSETGFPLHMTGSSEGEGMINLNGFGYNADVVVPETGVPSYVEVVAAELSDYDFNLSLDDISKYGDHTHYYDPEDLPYEDIDKPKTVLDFLKDIWEFIITLPSKIAHFGDTVNNFIIGLFIPKDGYFEEIFDHVQYAFNDRLGLFLTPIQMFIDLLKRFSVLQDTKDFVIRVPDFTLPGFKTPILTSTSYDLNNVFNEPTFCRCILNCFIYEFVLE